jgi:hypothetical protein
MATSAIHARTIGQIAAAAKTQNGIRPADLQPGDWVIVRTKNSTYTLSAVGDGTFVVSGGWFSSERADGQRRAVRGCTWGGSALLQQMVAAPGMCIEFDNGVRTTRAREVRVIRGAAPHIH